jgi:hypothetical protein
MNVSACTHGFLAKSVWTGVVATAATLGLAALGLGCSDAEGEFNDFVERSAKILPADSGNDVTGDSGDCLKVTQADVASGYYFTLSAVIVPTKPFVVDGTVTIDEAANTVSFSFQPLRADDKTTPVGTPILGGPFPIQPDGSFVGDFGNISMDGAANPISGSELATELVLKGAPGGWCGASEFVCGDVEGIASKPLKDLDLKGSTFTMQKLSAPGVYPAPVISCAAKP